MPKPDYSLVAITTVYIQPADSTYVLYGLYYKTRWFFFDFFDFHILRLSKLEINQVV